MIKKSASLVFISVALGLGALPQIAASQNISPQQSYQDAVAYCKSGQPGIDVKNCMRDAGAALQQAKRKGGGSFDSNFESNQRARCEALTGSQRQECIDLMSQNDVTVHGSVEGGGIIRERTITIPAE